MIKIKTTEEGSIIVCFKDATYTWHIIYFDNDLISYTKTSKHNVYFSILLTDFENNVKDMVNGIIRPNVLNPE